MPIFAEFEIWDGDVYRYTCHAPDRVENWSPFDEIEGCKNPRVIMVRKGVRTEIFE